jgi:hypothetical protein
MEVVTAFFLEAGFLGLLVYGEGRIGKRMMLFVTCMVSLATLLSVTWILVVSSNAPYGSTRRHSSRLPHLHPPRPSQHPAARAERLDDHGGWSARHADRGLEAVARRGHDRAALRPDAPARHLR